MRGWDKVMDRCENCLFYSTTSLSTGASADKYKFGMFYELQLTSVLGSMGIRIGKQPINRECSICNVQAFMHHRVETLKS